MKLSKSTRAQKKYQVELDGRTIHFGAAGYEDYTTHKDPERKAKYLKRHAGENWADPMTAGFWARWLLWNQPSLMASIRDVEKRLNFSIQWHDAGNLSMFQSIA